ncbi:MAG: hypothetical protein Kow0069_37470 [Promethearchaeota archaeon]
MANIVMFPFPESYVATVLVPQPDGPDAQVRFRPVLPSDVFPLKVMFDSLSQETRFFRFMYVKSEMTLDEIKAVTRIDYGTNMKVVAEVLDFPWVERFGLDLAGFAGYVDVTKGGSYDRTAEVSVVVADAWQGRGIGKRLFAHVLDLAARNGYSFAVGEMLVENSKMKHLMECMGYYVDFWCEEGLQQFCIYLDGTAGRTCADFTS